MAEQTQKIALQLAQALANITDGTPFVMQKVEIQQDINVSQNKGQQDINSLIKDLSEINRLLKTNSKNKKVENGFTICKSIIQLDFEIGQEALYEHINLLDHKAKGDLIALVVAQKQKDLTEKSIIYLLNIVLNEFNSLSFTSDERGLNTNFVNQVIAKEEIKASFGLATAFITASITKSNLIKELRKNPIKQMVKFLEVILILLQNAAILPVQDDKYIPSFEQLCEWVDVLIDAYYLNFCLKQSWKDLLEKIDAEIESRIFLYEQSKSFAESISTYQKCYDNIQKSINKVESQFYIKSIYL
ncbi:hypothetical protein ABPG72_009040 [Tetrahymena utriculariae]